jgi:preprotein translocase, SecE subunit, bacterial
MPDIEESKSKDKSTEKKAKPRDNKRFEGLKRFFTETRAEFRKIMWPSPKETFNQTAVVLTAIVVIGVFIWALDALDSWAIRMLITHI